MAWIVMKQCAVGDWHRRVLPEVDFTWSEGQSWVIGGPNGSGKSALAALWVGRLDAVAGQFVRSAAWKEPEESWIGFERQRLLLEWERHIDMTDVMEGPDPGTLVVDFVGDAEILPRFGLDGKGNRGLKHLSTGELRRACLARAWFRGVPVLVLDEPFEGLDASGVELLKALLVQARDQGVDLGLLTRWPEDRPAGVWSSWNLDRPGDERSHRLNDVAGSISTPQRFSGPARGQGEPLVEFRRVRAGYPGLTVLHDLNWTVHRGDRWLVTGPNGSGKSTLLSLIAGDHPQVFSNDIRLFGVRRGPELTLTQLRRRVGLVSYASHLEFRRLFGVTGLEVWASGFAGTVGLWTDPSWDQIQVCRALARDWGLAEALSRPWDELSWGTQRLILLGRALVSDPDLLLLDEPCQGLDPQAVRRVLEGVGFWLDRGGRTLIYVTHRPTEVDPASFLRLSLPESLGDDGLRQSPVLLGRTDPGGQK